MKQSNEFARYELKYSIYGRKKNNRIMTQWKLAQEYVFREEQDINHDAQSQFS
jgi:hypothetical protein